MSYLRGVLKSILLLYLIWPVGGLAQQAMQLQQVATDVYALVGPFGNRTPENHGNNSTSGFVVTDDGVVLIDPGGSYLGAKAIDRSIKQVTGQPVKLVIDTGGQDHRWLGNGYFKALGAQIVASKAAVADQHAREQDQMFMLGNLIGRQGLTGTEPVYADTTFDDQLTLQQGGVTFELLHVGPAHTPGDILVWLPKQKIVFAGDVVFVGRLLGVQSHSNSAGWIAAFDQLAALEPTVIVPGHGAPTDLATARKDTRDYLAFLRQQVGNYMEAGGDITGVGNIDQSRFSGLDSYDSLKGRNAQQVFQEMEWE